MALRTSHVFICFGRPFVSLLMRISNCMCGTLIALHYCCIDFAIELFVNDSGNLHSKILTSKPVYKL